MSRSFYDSPAQKKVVDALAAKRTQIAIQNARSAGDAKTLVNRERQLQILQPPAQFESAVDALSNASYQNTLAIKNLETFMYSKDVSMAFGELLKHNEINSFNQYYGLFKKLIGDRKIGYLEFGTLWSKFRESLSNGSYNENILTLEPENKIKELIQPIKGHISFPLSSEFFSPSSSTTSSPRQSLEGKTIDTNLEYLKTLNTKQIKELIIKYNLNDKEISILGPKGGVTGVKRENLIIALDAWFKRKGITLYGGSGKGIGKHKNRMRGGGISNQSLLHRYNILAGEVNSGNNNPLIVKELYELIDELINKKLLKKI